MDQLGLLSTPMPSVKRPPECWFSSPVVPCSSTRVLGWPSAPGMGSLMRPDVTRGGSVCLRVNHIRYSKLAWKQGRVSQGGSSGGQGASGQGGGQFQGVGAGGKMGAPGG